MMIKRILLAALFSIAILSVKAHAAEDMMNRRVSGKVVATDTEAMPNTIVVKAKTSKTRNLIVGADVTDKTAIKKRGNAATLKDIKPGESVEMSYTRNNSVEATSITVK